MADRIGALDGAVVPMTPAQFDAKAKDDHQRFGAIVRERKIVGDRAARSGAGDDRRCG